MAEKFIISHDVGTGGSKAVLTDITGAILTSSFEPYETLHPRPHWAEQNPEDWWRAVTTSTRRLLEQSKVKPSQVIGMGFATQMLGVLPLDTGGRPLRPGIIWLDNRAVEQAARMVRRLGGAKVMMMVAGAIPSGKDVICKILWIRDEEPEVWERTHKIVDVTGYLVFKST